MNYPSKIEVTFTAEDLNKAERYESCTNCLLATALHRMGFTKASVGGEGHTFLTSTAEHEYNMSSSTPFRKELVVTNRQTYRRSLIGKTFILIRQ